MLYHHNLVRKNLGLPEFEYSAELSDRADNHVKFLIKKNRLIHSKINPGEAENLAKGTNLSESQAMKLWLRSPNHRLNLVGSYKKIGYAKASKGSLTYYVVIFGQ